MKKQSVTILICLTILFCTFTLGFFLGRNHNHETVLLSQIPVEALHRLSPVMPTETLSHNSDISFPIDINTASATELTALPGIGESLAGRIIEYRTLNGSFSNPEELMNVPGIGTTKYEKILNYIITGG